MSNIDNSLHSDLLAVYLTAYDNASTSPSAVHDVHGDDINTRYAREILGLLTRQGLLTETLRDGEDQWTLTNRPDTREEAIMQFEKQFTASSDPMSGPGKPQPAWRRTTRTLPTEPTATDRPTGPAPNCRCGCNQQVIRREATYLPGHDARHAGRIARNIAEQVTTGANTNEDPWNLLRSLPTDALRVKAAAHAQRLVDKPRRGTGTGTAQQVPPATGTVKVGRWAYPALRNSDGNVTRNTKRDGSGDWVPADATKFVAS